MNKQIDEQWSAALRSGEYKQGGFMLLCNNHFCCLGVLCDLHAKETGNHWVGVEDSDERKYFDEPGFLPQEVKNWAEMNSHDGSLGGTTLAYLNDNSGFSFKSIADIIDKNWEDL